MTIDAPSNSLHLHANVDLSTGVYRDMSSRGHFEITGRTKEAKTGAAPLFHMDQQLASSAIVTRVARWDPRDKRSWIFDADNGAYKLRLGSNWAQTSRSQKFSTTVYRQAESDAQLTTWVTPMSLVDEQKYPLSSNPTRLVSALAKAWEGSQVTLTWSKLFNVGLVYWSRCRIDITEANGGHQTYWNQAGYGPQDRYTFELIRPGMPSEETEADALGIFDSIALTKVEPSQ